MPYQRIAILENLIEAQLLSAALDDQGIGHRIRSYHDTAYDGLFQFQKGWGDIQASETDGPEVLRALADIRLSANPGERFPDTH